jgi:hypothetical protein
MEIRTDFTALVLPSPADLQIAAERARLASEDVDATPRRERGRFSFGRRRVERSTIREAVAR